MIRGHSGTFTFNHASREWQEATGTNLYGTGDFATGETFGKTHFYNMHF